MRNKCLQALVALFWVFESGFISASPLNNDIVFIDNFNSLKRLNDTGIIWAADYSSGNNNDCTSSISAEQDCHSGRDITEADNTDGFAGFSYTKIDSAGNALPSTATSWTCVLDNVTGLLWEVKTSDGALHDKDRDYRWGGITASGYNHPNREGPYYNNWDSLVNGSNSDNFCGKSNWKVPTTSQLSSIIHHGVSNPSIDTNFFPNAIATWYWTADPFIIDSSDAWLIYFGEGNISNNVRHVSLRVRLVSSNQ